MAEDAAGNFGQPSRPFVVVPTVRPATAPHAIPHWAQDLYAWQHTHSGTRPATAPKRPPAWYWAWAAWRANPFHLKQVEPLLGAWPKLGGNTTRPRIDAS